MSLTKVSYSMIQGAPINVSDYGAVGDGTTNDSAAIRLAINAATAASSVNSIALGKYSTYVMVEFVGGKTYKVVGDNPLGYDLATFGGTAKSYGINLNGATIHWEKNGAGQSLIKNAGYLSNFTFINGSVYVTDTSTSSPNGYFVSSNNAALPAVSAFSYHLYDSVDVSSVGYPLSRVFNLDGTTHTDQSTVKDCEFVGWETFYYSSNPEAVDWSFYDCRCFPNEDNFKFFHHAGQWSGGMRIIGCELGSRSSGTIFYATGTITTSNNGYVYCNSRLETGVSTEFPTTFVSIVDATHGRYEIAGMNFYAGGGATTSRSAIIRGSAEVTFRDCVLPQAYGVEAQTITEWDTTHANGLVGTQLLFDNCVFALGLLIPYFSDTGGTSRTFRYCLENGLITPVVRSINNNFINVVNGIARSYTSENECKMRYEITRNSSGYAYISDYPTTTPSTQIPSQVLITSIKVNVVATTVAKLGVFFGASATTPLATVALSNSNPTVAEMIPATNYGISVPNLMGSDQNIIWFGGCDSGGNLVTSSLQGWAEITYSGIDSRNQMAPTDVTTLI